MILSTGIDIVQISRIREMIENPRFLKKVYTDNEILYLENRGFNQQSAAGIFAAKEAVSKALETGIRGFSIKDIEILRDELGKPYVVLHNNAEEIRSNKSISNINISISHEREYAVAIAISEITVE